MTRRIIAALLSAAALMPGVAAAQDGRHGQHRNGGAHAQADRHGSQGRVERQRPARAEAPRQAERRPQQRAARPDHQNRGADQRQHAVVRQDRGGNGRSDYRRAPQQTQALRYRNRDGRYDGRGQVGNRGHYDRGNYAYRGRQNTAAVGSRRSWNNNWRNDRRYDWNRYRTYNRGAFHLPRYYAPYGWNNGYRRFAIGFRLAAPLFGQNYWIDDPYDYRLPAAYGSYRWVRYYGDAILVDVRSGTVVDVIHDIFW